VYILYIQKRSFLIILSASALFFFFLGYALTGSPLNEKTYAISTANDTPLTTTGKSKPPQSSTLPTEKLNINAASASQLLSLPGFTEKMAHAVIEHRRLYGEFEYIEHLLRVSEVTYTAFIAAEKYICTA